MLCAGQMWERIVKTRRWSCLNCSDVQPAVGQGRYSRQSPRNCTCSTRSPLQTTIVGTRSLGSSSSSVSERSSRYRGTTNSSSHVHRSQILSMHGTQHRAESGEEGVVYACGTRLTYMRQDNIATY